MQLEIASEQQWLRGRNWRNEVKPERIHQEMYAGDSTEVVQRQSCYLTKDCLHGAYFSS